MLTVTKTDSRCSEWQCLNESLLLSDSSETKQKKEKKGTLGGHLVHWARPPLSIKQPPTLNDY